MSSTPRTLGIRGRGRARRRLRYLRRLRELQVRDVGGFTFDLYRFGEQREQLVREKLEAVIATDKEIHALAELLGEAGKERVHELRQPGVGGTCANCAAFHASDARFCDRCGVELAGASAHAPGQEPAEERHEEPAPPPAPLAPPAADEVTIVRRPPAAAEHAVRPGLGER